MSPSANSPEKRIPKVAVIGGGISGLAALYRLIELSIQRNFPVDPVLLESSQRLGGVISSTWENGCLLESGPDAIFTEKPWGTDFCKKMGLANELIGTNPHYRTSFVALKGKLLPVPEGFYLMAPSEFLPLMTSGIFTWRGKLRALCDLFIRRKRVVADESLASFVRRRLGNEVLERMAQPMVGGIYSADPEELSLEATFPNFLEMEREYGSVILGLIARRKKILRSESARGPRYSLFVSFKQGLQSLIHSVSEKIPREAVRLETEIENITFQSGSSGKFTVRGKKFETGADAVCLSLSAPQSSRVLKLLDTELSKNLEKIPYHSGVTVNLVYRRKDIAHPLNGFGFVVPEMEKRTISGCTFSSVKFPNRCPGDQVILRAFIGGKRCGEIIEYGDDKIESLVRKDLIDILNIFAHPVFSRVKRHPYSLPQYGVGHLELVRSIEERAGQITGLALAGNGYYGTGIPDCIRSGELAAEKIMNFLQSVKG